MANDNYKYIHFTISLLRTLFIDQHRTLKNILIYGLWNYADYLRSKKEIDFNHAALTLLKEYISGDLPEFLEDEFIGFTEAGHIVSLPGEGEYVDPADIDWLYFYLKEDNALTDILVKHFWLLRSAYFLEISVGDWDRNYKIYREIKDNLPGSSEPFVGIKMDMAWDYLSTRRDEKGLVSFAAYLAARSILSNKKYMKTNKAHIIARMFGYTSVKDIGGMHPDIKKLFDKYSKRYHQDKILNDLELKWNIINYSNRMRGLYLANGNKISLERLILHVEKNKEATKMKKHKQSKAEIKKKVLQQIASGNYSNKTAKTTAKRTTKRTTKEQQLK